MALTPRVHLPDRYCQACGQLLVRKPGEGAQEFRERRCCDRTCAGRQRQRVRSGDDAILREQVRAPPARYPGARSDTFEQAPPRCWVCQGVWRYEETHLTCLGCGRTWYTNMGIRRALQSGRNGSPPP